MPACVFKANKFVFKIIIVKNKFNLVLGIEHAFYLQNYAMELAFYSSTIRKKV